MTAMHLLSKRRYTIGSDSQTATVYPAAHANLPHPLRTSLKNHSLKVFLGEVLNIVNVTYQQIKTCKVKLVK